MRYLIWLVIGFAVYTWVKRAMAKLSSGGQADPRRHTGNQLAETMRQCAHCGTYIPASEAVLGSAGAIFCCEEHRVQHASR